MVQRQLNLITLESLTVTYSLLLKHQSSGEADKFLRDQGFNLGDQKLEHLLVHSVRNLGEYLYLNTLLKGDTATPDHAHAYCGREDTYWKLHRTLGEYLGLFPNPEFNCDNQHWFVAYHQALGRVTRVARKLKVDIHLIRKN